MTAYEKQIKQTSAYYDAQIADIEGAGAEILCSRVRDSRLHEIINNPYDEGIDEG